MQVTNFGGLSYANHQPSTIEPRPSTASFALAILRGGINHDIVSGIMMKKLMQNIILSLAIFLAIAGVFAFIAGEPILQKPPEVTLSQIAQRIKEGRVNEIRVDGNDLEILLSDQTKEKARKGPNTDLEEILANYGITTDELNKLNITYVKESMVTGILLQFLYLVLPFLIIGGFLWYMMRQAQRGAGQALSFGKVRARLFSHNKKDSVTFKDVAGVEEAKKELEEVVDFLKNPKKFLDIGARIPRGVLLMGAPGTGKTLLARAVAGEANVPFFHISGSEFVEMFVGVGASRVRDLFETAKKSAPAIVFIDEIDAVGRQRGAGLGGGHDEREQTLNQILVEMDGFERDSNVIVMAATNRPDILDPALLRPGRFDRRVILDEPDINDREAILKIHSKDKPLTKDVNLRKIAERTPGFTGADLANLFNEAAILVARENKKIITQQDIIDSIEKVLLGPERRSHLLSKKEKEIAAYHEAGHAVVAAHLPHSDPVHKVSIVSRGRVAGYTLKLPIEDKHFRSKSEFLDELAVMMGGYASEKLIFNELTTGASNDLQKASELARKLAREYGMSEALGPVTYVDKEELIFLGRELGEQRHYSEEIAAKIDKEVSKFIGNAFRKAMTIIKEQRKKLDLIAARLIEKETIEQEEFEQLIKNPAAA